MNYLIIYWKLGFLDQVKYNYEHNGGHIDEKELEKTLRNVEEVIRLHS